MAYNVIFIDDSDSMQKAVSTIFINNPDFNLNPISEPSSLFKIAKDFHPDIIILSYNSVNTEVKGNVSEIKNNADLSPIPLILLVPSDLSDNERELLIRDGVNGFIYRPFEKEMFLSKIKRILGIIDIPEKTGEKIYDISLFETKETDKKAPESPAKAEPAPAAPVPATPAETEDALKEDENDSFGIYSNNVVNIDSAELSQAFENLFKDDVIFEEFQKLNKKDEPEMFVKMQEESLEAQEPVLPAEDGAFEEPEKLNKTIEEQPVIEEPVQELNKNIINLEENIIIKNKITTEGGLKLEILDEQSLLKLDALLKNSIQKTLEEIKPQVIENIKNILPEIIERLVKEEIEKIKQTALSN
ncbi:MAG: hypothetical protein M1412_07505 [Deltaproteobacteria bacterium]|nr:hypothetical protein [Deltaproteobacteria bacterium]MCL5892987.1 hypothetical protein [Deltaproteobacteria bacterium]